MWGYMVMNKLIESVPNISEGRDGAVIARVADAVRRVPGVTLMDVSSDLAHNRSVLSILGEPEALLEALFALASACVDAIDLREHRGRHPRMGAVDVIPLIPIRNAEMGDCVELSKRLGRRLWHELRLPVILYENSASAEHRRNLAAVRRGEFEGLSEKLSTPEWAPDFGGDAPHPSAGCVAVGARAPLIAFNIELSTGDVAIAKGIARVIRESSGGLPCVKALGIYLDDRDIAQVSINMTDYTQTPLHRVMRLVRDEAAKRGVRVTRSEVVGLCPANALIDAAIHHLQLVGFERDRQVLENHLL